MTTKTKSHCSPLFGNTILGIHHPGTLTEFRTFRRKKSGPLRWNNSTHTHTRTPTDSHACLLHDCPPGCHGGQITPQRCFYAPVVWGWNCADLSLSADFHLDRNWTVCGVNRSPNSCGCSPHQGCVSSHVIYVSQADQFIDWLKSQSTTINPAAIKAQLPFNLVYNGLSINFVQTVSFLSLWFRVERWLGGGRRSEESCIRAHILRKYKCT